MPGSGSAAPPRHGRPAACATRDAETERPGGLAPGGLGLPAAAGRGPLWSGTAYLLWYGPVIAVNLLLLDWVSANALVSAEAALLDLFTAGLRNGQLVATLTRAAVWRFSGRLARKAGEGEQMRFWALSSAIASAACSTTSGSTFERWTAPARRGS